MQYKIKHRKICKSYSAENDIFAHDLYILSYLDVFSVISHRSGGGKLNIGDRFCELLDVKDRVYLNSYVYNDGELPLVVCSDVGTAIINRFFMPSTLVFTVAIFSDEKDGEVVDELLRSYSDRVMVPEHYRRSGKKKCSKALSSEIETVLNNYKYLLEKSYVPINTSPRITVGKLYSVLEAMARLAGCSVDAEIDAEIICFDTFDLAAFKSFLVAMLMLARREASDRKAKVELSWCGDGISTRVTFATESGRRAMSFLEVRHFWDFADRNRMLFEATEKDGNITVRLCPTRKDWSLLELKAPFIFDWDS